MTRPTPDSPRGKTGRVAGLPPETLSVPVACPVVVGTSFTRPGSLSTAKRSLLAAFVAAASLVAGCSSAEPSRTGVTEALITSGLPPAQARCAAAKLFTVLDGSQRRTLAEQGSGALTTSTSTKLSRAISSCAGVDH